MSAAISFRLENYCEEPGCREEGSQRPMPVVHKMIFLAAASEIVRVLAKVPATNFAANLN
jgi:hypothetical protein